MTRIRTLFYLALPLALCVSGQALRAQADDPTVQGQLHFAKLGPISAGVSPDASPTVFTALLNIAANPPTDGSGNPYWPCYTGGSDTDCSKIPAGAIVVGEPLVAAVVPHTCKTCAQIYWVVETAANAKGGAVSVDLTVTQGSTTIFSYSGSTGQTLAPSEILAVWYTGVTFKKAVAGQATITVTNTVGTAKTKGTTSVILQ